MSEVADYVNGEPEPIHNDGPSMHDLVILDLGNRKDFGLKKYDTVLQAYNGRNFLQDLYEELQDAIVYTRGALEEQSKVSLIFKAMVQGFVSMHDAHYPDRSDEVIVKLQGDIPGWLLTIMTEVLGDRFEHLKE